MTTCVSGIQLKHEGLLLAESKHKDALTCAQFVAALLGAKQTVVTADDVFEWIDPKAVGNAAGSIFRNGDWEFVCWTDSIRPSNHGRPLRAWALKK